MLNCAVRLPVWAKIAAAIVAGMVFVWLFSLFVPYYMDEYYQYYALQCYGREQIHLTLPCDPYALSFFGLDIALPLRSYFYMGSNPALLYAPLYYLWTSPLSARFMGLIFLAASAWLLSVRFRWHPAYIFTGLLLFFPYAYQHIVDTGIIGLQAVLIFSLVLLGNRLFATRNTGLLVAVTALLFFGLWTKLTFLWLLPPLGLIFAVQARQHRKQQNGYERSFWTKTAIAGVVLTALTITLYTGSPANTHSKRSFWHELTTAESHDVSELVVDAGIFHSKAVNNLQNPYFATQKIYRVQPKSSVTWMYSILLFSWLPLLILYLLRQYSLQRLLWPIVYLVCFCLVLVAVSLTESAHSVHHVILAVPFYILAALETLTLALRSSNTRLRMVIIVLAAAATGLNLYVWGTFAEQPERNASHPSKLIALEVLKDDAVSGEYLTVILSWGVRMDLALFGNDNQLFHNIRQVRRLPKILSMQKKAHTKDRKFLVVYRQDHRPHIQKALQKAIPAMERCQALPDDAMWQILYEPTPAMRNTCARLAAQQQSPSLWQRLVLKTRLVW